MDLMHTQFKSSLERFANEAERRKKLVGRVLPFGLRFLDRALRGIFPTDLVLIGAGSGVGKTELACSIAKASLDAGKRVYFFALEAEESEIERRIKYKFLSKAYKAEGGIEPLSYLDWYMRKYEDLFAPYEGRLQEYLNNFARLNTLYRESDEFDLATLKRHVMAISNKADLVIIDHIHYVDFDSPNENQAMSDIIKGIRDLALISEIPHVVIAHLRKKPSSAGVDKKLIPSVDDFHGTSNLVKVATKAIIISAGEMISPSLAATYFRVTKARMIGAASRYIGATLFNIETNDYEDAWNIGRLSADETKFIKLSDEELPSWIK